MRLDANIAALGELTQQTIAKSSIAISGHSYASEILIANLVGLGYKEIQLYEHKPIVRTLFGRLSQKQHIHKVSDGLHSFCPFAPLECIRAPALFDTLESLKPSLCIDMNYQPDIFLQQFAKQTLTPLVHPFAKTTQTNYHTASFTPGGALQLGASLADKVTQWCTKLTYPSVCASTPQTKLYDKPLIVGAGGIGTYVATACALQDSPPVAIGIMDPDYVEQTNLNRQLYYGRYIGVAKVTALAEILKQFCPKTKIIPIVDRCTNNKRIKGFNAVYCCVDSLNARIDISTTAHKNQLPLIEGGCTPHAASASFTPSTHALHIRKGWSYQATQEQQPANNSCARQANPSIVTTNCFSAGLMSEQANAQYLRKTGTVTYVR